MKKISTAPFLLGFEKLVKREEFFYSPSHLIVVDKQKLTHEFPLSSITSIRKTHVKINSKMYWEIEIRHEGKYYSKRFLTDLKWGNSNFKSFIELMQINYLGIVKSNLNWWNL